MFNLSELKKYLQEHISLQECDKLCMEVVTLEKSIYSTEEKWHHLAQNILEPSWPLHVHKKIFHFVYSGWDEEQNGPAPIWFPTNEYLQENAFMKKIKAYGHKSYDEFQIWSVENEQDYVKKIIEESGIVFDTKPLGVMKETEDISKPIWLLDAKLNCYNSIFNKNFLDNTAIIANKDGENTLKYSYLDLKTIVDSIASSLTSIGITSGNTVAICANYTVESIATFLAAIKCGCVVNCILNNLSTSEVCKRLNISKPKVLFIDGSCQIDLNSILKNDYNIQDVVLIPSGQSNYSKNIFGWDEFLSKGSKRHNIPAYSYEIGETVFICFTSGTTGEPKGIPITHEMILVSAGNVIPKGEVVYWPTTLGTTDATSSLFSTFFSHASLALYYLGPLHEGFSKFIPSARITRLGTYPRIQTFWRENDTLNPDDLKYLKFIFTSGEVSGYDDQFDLWRKTRYKPLLDSCGATELGKSYLWSLSIKPIAVGYLNSKVPGRDIVFNKYNKANEILVKSHHFGLCRRLLNYNHDEIYFQKNSDGAEKSTKQLRWVGDLVQIVPGGFYKILSRVDDSLNIGGGLYYPKVIEECVNSISYVKEAAAISISNQFSRTMLILYVVLRDNVNETRSIKDGIHVHLNKKLDSNLKISDIVIIDSLPHTATGKLKRSVLRKQYELKVSSSPTVFI